MNSTSLPNQWVEIDCGDRPIYPYSYRFMTSENTLYCPKRFYLKVSNDYVNWDTIHATYSGTDHPQLAVNTFSNWLTTSGMVGPYRWVRFHAITAYHANYVQVKRLEFLDQHGMNSLGRVQWEDTGGFVPGTTRQIDMAFGLKPCEHLPSVSVVTANYMTAQTRTTELIGTTWDLSAANPTKVQFCMKTVTLDQIDPAVDLEVWVSVDGGANYEQIPITLLTQVSGFSYYVGQKTALTPRNSNVVKTKVRVLNYRNIRIYGTAAGFDYV
jgi:hypothetical protein